MESPSKEELLASIQPGMKLTKYILKQIYGYEISYPGFAEQAIAALEKAGCGKARQYYEDWVSAYESKRDAELKEVSKWYMEECEKRWEKKRKEGGQQRKRRERKQTSRKWMDGLY